MGFITFCQNVKSSRSHEQLQPPASRFAFSVVKWLLWLTTPVLFTDFAAVCVILRDLRERISEKWAEKLTGCINLSFNANSTTKIIVIGWLQPNGRF